MEKIEKSELEVMAKDSDNPVVRDLAKQKITEEFKGDEVAQKMIQLSQIIAGQTSQTGVIDVDKVKDIVKEQIETEKISIDNLDATLRSLIDDKPTTIKLTVNIGGVKTTHVVKQDPFIKQPLMQNVLSDVLARNNVYLYGGAGTGKSYSATILADTLGWNIITINCNQFTSSLELIGGQTIDGYQEGKVIMAYGNIQPDGNPTGKGCILLLDKLPKIDPNTAGILNAALAQVGEFNSKGEGKPIENARGQKIPRGEVFIMGTGNSLLNTKDVEYEANFKQDLSLQDRFAGSTYKVFVNREYEWKHILFEQWAFIFIYLNKLRDAITEEGFTAKAFVSIRLMMSAQKTYNVYRTLRDAKGQNPTIASNPKISFTPAPYPLVMTNVNKATVKTVQTTVDEFLALFTTEQSDLLKDKTDYTKFLKIINEKNKLPLDKLNTDSEIDEVNNIIQKDKQS